MLYVADGKASTLGMTFALLSEIVYSMYIVLLRKSNLGTVPLMALSFWNSVYHIFSNDTCDSRQTKSFEERWMRWKM